MSAINFAGYLKAWRARHGLSEKDAGAILGVSTVTLFMWEEANAEPKAHDQEFIIALMQRYTGRKK